MPEVKHHPPDKALPATSEEDTRRRSVPDVVYAVLAYPFLLLLSLFFAALIWARWAPGTLYRCTDPVFTIFDIIPPFVHPWTDDVYLVSPWKVWLLWGILIVTAVIVPALAIAYIWRREKNYDG
jgi:hypothetical protein